MFAKKLPFRSDAWKSIVHQGTSCLRDLTAFVLSGFLAFELRFDGELPFRYLHAISVALIVWAGVKSAVFLSFGLSRGRWRYTSAYDTVRIAAANTVGSVLGGVIITILLGAKSIPYSVYLLDLTLSLLITLGGRVIVRVATSTQGPASVGREKGEKTIIYGAGSAGLLLLSEIRHSKSLRCNVIGLVDDDPSKGRMILSGKAVLGTGQDLPALVRKFGVAQVLIAVPSADAVQILGILKHVLSARVDYKMVPGLEELITGKELGKQIRKVAVEDLLGRKPVDLDQNSIRERIEGKVVMVTGAAGSIGSELCRQIAKFRPATLVGFDEAETPLFYIERELKASFPELVFQAEIGSIMQPEHMQNVMQAYQPSILFHAAAYKHVPLMEKQIFAAAENNIFGTWKVAQAAIRHGVEDFVMISTDKAVRPTSMMGATKRIAELLISALEKESSTKFVAVRFGNVLGSNGSVVPIFKEQIAAGGPVTVTHPEMTRYFMTIPEAAQLVLQAFSIGKGGEVFVLDMGKPVRILDLARNLILLSGLQPDRDVEIKFSGIRPGEKLHEELSLEDEHLLPTSHQKIRCYIGNNRLDLGQLKALLREMEHAICERDVIRYVLLLKEMIPGYNPGNQLLKTALSAVPDDSGRLNVPVFSVQETIAVGDNPTSAVE
jgi:FlaA1/EpsC-like NDP-sugar epimerase